MNYKDISDNDKVFEILNQFEFFQGQRAGRELWFDKPEHIQNEDIKNFCEKTAFLKKYITDLQNRIHELEGTNLIYKGTIAFQKSEIDRLNEENQILSSNADTAFQDGLNEAQELYAQQVRKDIREKIEQTICENTYPSIDADGEPINVWRAESGYKAIKELLTPRSDEK